MKVITKCVEIENEKFYLISDFDKDGNKYYGTIPYTEVENGRMKRALNGFEIAIAKTIGEALERRENDIKTNKRFNKYISEGYTREEAAIKAVLG